jgi:hypothetical protein
MRKLVAASAVFASAIGLGFVGTAAAHDAGPCSGSGRDYAQHHIRPNAEDGNLGNEGHKPGHHQGFSTCRD